MAKIIESNKSRHKVYVAAGVVMAAVIIGTLITLGFLDMSQVEGWISTIVLLVTAFVGLGQSVLSALNTDKDVPLD